MTVDEAIAQVLKYHGCGHPVMKAAGTLRLEVERLRAIERKQEGQERCEECGQWFDAEQCVLTADGCYLCATCADSLREDTPYTASPNDAAVIARFIGGPQ